LPRVASSPAIVHTLCALVVVAGPLPAQHVQWTIDPGHSHIGFTVRHLVIATIRGHFATFTGDLRIHPHDTTQSSVMVQIDAASIESGNTRRDNAVRGDNFLAVNEHPRITFKSTRIERVGSGWLAHGELAIKGTVRIVSIPFTFAVTPDRQLLAASGALVINRDDFGITAVPAAVGREVTISFEIEANPAGRTP
jgi:polyisoprenoid-binding protein YceI